jgi:hypothetical protein
MLTEKRGDSTWKTPIRNKYARELRKQQYRQQRDDSCFYRQEKLDKQRIKEYRQEIIEWT